MEENKKKRLEIYLPLISVSRAYGAPGYTYYLCSIHRMQTRLFSKQTAA